MSEYIEPKGLGRLKDNLKSFIIGSTVIGIPILMYVHVPDLMFLCVYAVAFVVFSTFLGGVVRVIFEDFKG